MREVNKLYQYKPLNKFTIINLLNGDIRLNSPRVFNDPYDCKILDGFDEFIVDGFLMKQLKDQDEVDKYKREKHDNYEKMLQILKTKKFDDKLANEIKMGRDVYFSLSDNNLFVSCFSEENTSMLMWSHYANYHKGICIEYSKNAMFDKCEPEMTLSKVNYTDKCVQFDFHDKNAEWQLREVCYTKSTCWSYEKEWRIVGYSDKKIDGFNVKFIKPTAIYLGSKIDESDKEFIKRFCEQNKINLYQMQLDKGSFNIYPQLELEFEEPVIV